ncbi:hypothetical protein OGAPHI_007094 [Ogataea philodendri]|uniref:Uncharacterized protein n=1 Tax=Ogataea philodendri TaxID=1378263 RepID=A0A9P8NVA4_9ASCO|nr:uncharacterized protein OGAPHI_007094 [Ogataea philodendri]KAH3660508.1 hypothetical protein OGAPHI_007094 [Ogataea philodendri]
MVSVGLTSTNSGLERNLSCFDNILITSSSESVEVLCDLASFPKRSLENVAENTSDWNLANPCFGRWLYKISKILVSSSKWPSWRSLSASSKTKMSEDASWTAVSVFFSNSSRNRPGVAMITLGLSPSKRSCFWIDSPPVKDITDFSGSGVYLNNCWRCFITWLASSLVGVKMIPFGWSFLVASAFSRIGIPYANVLPDPVMAFPITSFSSMARGIVVFWISVGLVKPSFCSPCKVCADSCNELHSGISTSSGRSSVREENTFESSSSWTASGEESVSSCCSCGSCSSVSSGCSCSVSVSFSCSPRTTNFTFPSSTFTSTPSISSSP